MKHFSCQLCGLGILPGGSFYKIKTQIISGFDGVIAGPLSGTSSTEFKSALDAVKNKTDQELMEDVFEEINIVVCPACRHKFRSQIKSMLNCRFLAPQL